MQRLLKALEIIETKYANVANTVLARRYEDGLNALRTDIDAEQHLAAVRLEQWIKVN